EYARGSIGRSRDGRCTFRPVSQRTAHRVPGRTVWKSSVTSAAGQTVISWGLGTGGRRAGGGRAEFPTGHYPIPGPPPHIGKHPVNARISSLPFAEKEVSTLQQENAVAVIESIARNSLAARRYLRSSCPEGVGENRLEGHSVRLLN